MDKSEHVKEIMELTSKLDFIAPKDIPSIDLYMDQLTTFLEEHLNTNKRNDEEKVMTKTMINNYTKNDLLPSPEKKRYSKDQLILLIYIYYLKNVLSINDIQVLLSPMIENHYKQTGKNKDISDIYEELYSYQQEHYGDIVKDIVRTFDKASCMYDADTDPYMHDMSLVSLLAVDVYVRKKYIEFIVDRMKAEEESKKQTEANKKKAAKKQPEKKQPVKKQSTSRKTK